MDNSQSQPLPPGVGVWHPPLSIQPPGAEAWCPPPSNQPPGVEAWRPPPSNQPSQFHPGPLQFHPGPRPHAYPMPYDTRPSGANNQNAANIYATQPFHPSPYPNAYPMPYSTRPNNGNNQNTAGPFYGTQPHMTFPPSQSAPGVTTAAGNMQSDLGGHPTAQEVANHNGTAANIESAVQEAVLHEQDIETQQVIQNQRHAKATSDSSEYGEDILSSRRDPNALKEHLLKMTVNHRTEMANKRRKSLHPDNVFPSSSTNHGVGLCYHSFSPRKLARLRKRNYLLGYKRHVARPRQGDAAGTSLSSVSPPLHLMARLKKELVLDEWFFTDSCRHFGADYNYEGMTACMNLALMIR